MKPTIYIFLASLAVLFVLSIYSNVKLIDSTPDDIAAPDTTYTGIKAFDPAMEKIPGFTELENRMEAAIITDKAKDRSLKNWLIAANFTVTILTALAALIASIKSVKALIENKTTVWIAVITFLATAVNFAQTEITSTREVNNKKTEKIRQIRNDMESLSVEDLAKQITRFTREFNEL
jgi:hypothetical protein